MQLTKIALFLIGVACLSVVLLAAVAFDEGIIGPATASVLMLAFGLATLGCAANVWGE